MSSSAFTAAILDGQSRQSRQSRQSSILDGESRACVIVPAYESALTVGAVIAELRVALPELEDGAILVVDDGSRDGTAEVAREAGAEVTSHPRNLGKGAALATGLALADRLGFAAALTVDADGQHPPESSRAVLFATRDPETLVLGVRDLVKDGAPRANVMSNGISNYFLSLFTGRKLKDTQCGLRRYPVRATLALGVRARGYAFEAEVVLRALAAGMPLVEEPIAAFYPPEHLRVTHFDSVRDPARIIGVVLRTLYDIRMRGTAGSSVQ